jgi:hypothetical protein
MLVLWSLLAVAASRRSAPSVSPADTLIFSGRQRHLEVAIPRLEATVEIDGVLDEPAWSRAAVLTDFSSYFPTDDRPAPDSTVVRVWYSPTAIYFGVRAYAAPGTVRATLATRDNLLRDDVVAFFISTFNDNRQAYEFAVNPLGVQLDGVLREGATGSNGIIGSTAGIAGGRQDADPSPDFVYRSKGRVIEEGFEVEVEIPFKSIRFPAQRVQDWGLHVERTHRANGAVSSWVPAKRDAASYLSQAATLKGLTDLRRGLVLDLTPVVTSSTTGARMAAGGWDYSGGRPTFGGDLRWGMTPNLTLNATVRPDFSQVESDAGQVSFDPRATLFFPEKRPFFVEGIELFQTPYTLVYTRQIVRPLAATKLTGKISSTSVAVLAAVDDQVASTTGNRNPTFGIVRLQHDLGGKSRVGLLYTGEFEGADFNHVLATDARLAFGDAMSLEALVAASHTRAIDRTTTAPLWNAAFVRNGRRFSLRWTTDAISDQFETRAGFVSRRNVANARWVNQVAFYGKPNGLVERVSFDFSPFLTWRYVDLVQGRGLQDDKWHLNSNWRFRGGWALTASLLYEYQRFDPDFYASYRLLRPVVGGGPPDTLAFGGSPKLHNVDYLLSLTTPELHGWSGNALLIEGRDVNFLEWQRGHITSLNVGASWRPTPALRLDGSYILQRYARYPDGSIAGLTQIPRLKVEYQLSRALFLRTVGEYRAERRDSLFDYGRTGLPIAILDPTTGVYSRATGFDRNTLRVDLLVALQPNPGTVFFAGYGNTSLDDRLQRGQGFVRQADGFFLKGSYLFRF